MTSATSQPWASSPPSAGQLADPIAYIRQEHERQCQVCDQLEDMFNSLGQPPALEQAKRIRGFLLTDLPRHIEDEESDLFPALARRCESQEGLDEVLWQLASEHELDRELVELIVRELEAVIARGTARDPLRFSLNVRAFAETQRRHLMWENRVVLPLAERHLTAEDKTAMGRSMAARRGLTPPD